MCGAPKRPKKAWMHSLAGRQPDFQQFRMRDKKELERYVQGLRARRERAACHAREPDSKFWTTKRHKGSR